MLQRILFLLLLPALCFAQQAAPSLTATTEEVIVTGSKFARATSESPQRVTVIDSATVARASDIGQLLNEQAGIVVNGAYSNPGKDRSLFLRNGANQYTLVLIDGQPVLDPSSLGGPVDLRLLSLDGVKRVEILRGARSLLYGSDAVAGVVNLVTEGTQSPSPLAVHLRAAASRYGTYEGSIGAGGSTKKFDYRFGYDHFTTQGISEAAAPVGPNIDPVFSRDGARRQTLTAGLTYRPSPQWSIRPTLRRATFDGDYDAGSFQDADNTYHNELWLPALAVDYTEGDVRFGARYNYAATDRLFDSDFGENSFRGRAHQGDVYASWPLAERLELTAGTQVRREVLTLDNPDQDELRATNIAPYLQLNYRVKQLLLEGGYRYNDHSAFGGQSNFSLAAGLQLSEPWSARLSYGSAFQSPTLDQLGGPFGANPDLQPQVSTSLEAGTQLIDPRGRYSLSLSVFRREIEDLVVFNFAEGYTNQDELRDRGIELEGSVDVGESLRLNGNLTHVRGRLTSADGAGGTTETEDFFRRPRTSAFLGLTYRPGERFLARLSGSYTGERPDVYFDADFSRFEVELEPYLIVNAYAEYRLLKARQLTLFGEVKNLTDTDFVEVTGFSTVGVVPRVGVAWAW